MFENCKGDVGYGEVNRAFFKGGHQQNKSLDAISNIFLDLFCCFDSIFEVIDDGFFEYLSKLLSLFMVERCDFLFDKLGAGSDLFQIAIHLQGSKCEQLLTKPLNIILLNVQFFFRLFVIVDSWCLIMSFHIFINNNLVFNQLYFWCWLGVRFHLTL